MVIKKEHSKDKSEHKPVQEHKPIHKEIKEHIEKSLKKDIAEQAEKKIKTKHHKKTKTPKHKEKPKLTKPKSVKLIPKKHLPTLQIKTERDIAMDFAQKVYQKFNKMVKAVILFGSTIKHTNVAGSDIDIILIVDDVSIKFDEKLIAWYREELGKIVASNPYKRDLHINTVKLTTWWKDLTTGDPTIINIIRYGEALIDFAGFFNPIKILLQEGKIKTTPEAIYNTLNRVPGHIMRSRLAELGSIEGCYWAIIESAQALLMAIKVVPPSPEHIAILLKEHFVDKKLLKMRSVTDLRDLYDLHRKIVHGEIKNIDGRLIDEWQIKSEAFFKTTMKLIDQIVNVQ